MKRVGFAVALVVVVVMVAPAVAWGDTLDVTCGPLAAPCDESRAWYDSATQVTWEVSPAPTKVVGCDSQLYQDVSTIVSCQVWWGAGGTPPTTQIAFPLNVEASSPTATVTPSSPPDSSGWYNHPVTGAPSASSFSGIASCAATTYAGPSTTAATVSATCVDHAGKTVTATSSPFAYDTTPPSLAVAASPADQSVALSWQTGGDPAPVESVTVTRSSPTGHRAAVTIYHGDADRYVDRHVRNGIHYTYTITAFDQAGHATVHAVGAIPGPRLLTPTRDARVSAPPILRWTPVHGATYYNVQLYRRGKLLSIWPSHAHLRLRRHWRFDGRRYRLAPGRYRWFVWPGFGKRSAARYGHPIGSGTFIVVR